MVGITPPIDPQPGTGVPVPGAAEGDLPPGIPDPSNEVINDCLERVISMLNLHLGYHVDTGITVDVPAASGSYGIQWLPMATMGDFGGEVDTVLSATYTTA